MIEIGDNQAFQEICREIGRHPFLALDTEFIREKTYYPVLALLQLGWPGRESILVDPLRISDWAPFHEVLRNPDIIKIFHAGRQDLEIFYYQMEEMPANCFDTQIAASMCGYGEQIAYAGLVSKLLGVEIFKGSSYTNWLKRPLTEAQLRYAREDVKYLPQLYRKLVGVAEKRNRLEWVREEIRQQLPNDLFDPVPGELWKKIKRAGSLRSGDAAVLRELAKWRDDLARQIDKPVRFILNDEVMVELAKVKELGMEQLANRRGVSSGFLDRHGQTILECHRRARALPKSEWPPRKDRRSNAPSDKAESLAELAWLLVKEVAKKANIAPGHLILKKELPGVIDAYIQRRDWEKHPIFRGWRESMAGKPLIELIEGRLSIVVHHQQILWKPQPGESSKKEGR